MLIITLLGHIVTHVLFHANLKDFAVMFKHIDFNTINTIINIIAQVRSLFQSQEIKIMIIVKLNITKK